MDRLYFTQKIKFIAEIKLGKHGDELRGLEREA